MPELPDVENFRRFLNANALGKPIAHVEVGSAKILRGVTAARLGSALDGRRMTGSRRHGKHLLAALDDGMWLTLHFGMTGRLAYFERLAEDPAHDRLRLDFADGHHLAYVDMRMLGEIGLAADADAFIAEIGLGPDALDPSLDEAVFVALLAGRRGAAKAALMDQSLLAGIGNVYSDEILFQARLHPKIRVQDLDASRVSELFRVMKRVLQTAIDRGAGSEELADRLPADYLLPRRKEGAECPRCGAAIAAMKAAGRTAYFCPACQPAPAGE